MRRSIAVAYLCSVLVMSCTILRHDPDSAARTAVGFAKCAFMQGDIVSSYSKLSERTKRTLSLAEYERALSAMHPAGRPLSLEATEYERVPSKPMIYIYLDGWNASERFYYRLVLEGTANAGYTVSGLFRGSGPYPASRLRTPFRHALSAEEATRP